MSALPSVFFPFISNRRRRNLLLWVLAICAFLFCWFTLTLLILLAQETLLGPVFSASSGSLSTIDPDSYAGRGIQLLVGHFNGNLPVEKKANLSWEERNANGFAPREGAGERGRAVELSLAEEQEAERTFGINQFNLLASDRISLKRSLPDVRRVQCRDKKYPGLEELPDTSVIIVFHNEAFSTLARTVTSVIVRSPPSLIREIILVDDFSSRTFLRGQLEQFLAGLSTRIKLIRARQRVGLIRARLMGAREAQGQVLTFLDSHCECTLGWLEPLLGRIREQPKAVVCPIIDVISDRSFAYQKGIELFRGGFNWNLQFRWYSVPSEMAKARSADPTAPIPSPTMAGGLFSIGRAYFEQLGAYDEGMDIWGGENIELSFRVWMCGGRVEILPCSHVGHVFRKASPHDFPAGSSSGRVLNANLARASEVWMDEWRHFFYKIAPQALALVKSQDVSERVELRRQLGCRDFYWFLRNVWPEHFLPSAHSFFGRIRHPSSVSCMQSRPSAAGKRHLLAMGQCSMGFDLWQFWVLSTDGHRGTRIHSDEHQCLSATEEPYSGIWKVQLKECGGHEMEFWQFERRYQRIVHRQSGLCLDEPIDTHFARDDPTQETQEHARVPRVRRCVRGQSSQKWELHSVSWLPQTAERQDKVS